MKEINKSYPDGLPLNEPLKTTARISAWLRSSSVFAALVATVLGSMSANDSYGDVVAAFNPGPATTSASVGRLTTQGTMNESAGQTFTPTTAVRLTTIDIEMRRVFSPGSISSVIVSLYNTAAGLPTGIALASVTRPFSDIATTPGISYTFDFTSDNLQLLDGVQYAFNVETNVNNGSTSLQPMQLELTGNNYTGGTDIHNFGSGYFQSSGDVIFTVNGIPEPSSLVLLGLGGLLVTVRRRVAR